MYCNVTIYKDGNLQKKLVEKDSLISDTLENFNIHMDYPCAKKGICKKCLVKVSGEISAVSEQELKLGDLLKQNYRLACCTKILGDCEITIENTDNVLQTADETIVFSISSKNPLFEKYGLAVDIGTTTISASLLDKNNIIATHSIKNPQIACGADVISRIEQQLAGKTTELCNLVVAGINNLIDTLCEKATINYKDIDSAVITGNTVMLYLLTKRDCTSLSVAPFTANYLGDEFLNGNFAGLHLEDSCKIYLPPCFGAFVGADITTAILASDMTKESKTSLLVDIGTNGEIALWNNDKLYCCSTAAGPAFEGVGIKHGMYGTSGAIESVSFENNAFKISTISNKAATGICGSGVVDAIATLLDLEIIDETGRMEYDDNFAENFIENDDGIEFILSGNIGICDKDIRAIQLAKSAICAGITTAIKENNLKLDGIETLYIAGGFGNYLNFENAGKIGLIPKELVKKVKLIGNAALLGSQIILFNKDKITEILVYNSDVKLLNLATSNIFMEEYMNNMFFE